MSTSSTSHPGDARGQPCRQTPDGPAADDGDTIADVRAAVPDAVDRRLEVGGQHRPLRRNRVGQHVHRRRGHDVARLVRMEDEHRSILQPARTPFDPADARIAVLDGRREFSCLETARACARVRSRARGR